MSENWTPLVLFRVDGSDRIGGGHVMRCLSLAGELARRGKEATFLCARLTPFLRARITEAGHKLHEIEPVPALLEEEADWDERRLAADAQRVDADRCRAALSEVRASWTVADHYRLDECWEQAFRGPGERMLIIDDMANRPHHCDLLVDQTFGRAADDYLPLVPADCGILTGARYAMLRPAFAEARAEALRRRASPGPVQRILVTLGTTDAGGVTGEVVEAVLGVAGDCRIDVVLGASAPSRSRIEALAAERAGLHLHLDVTDMVPLLVEADLAIGAAGTAALERCCLGLPAVTMVLAGNQRLVAQKLTQAGAAIAVRDSGEAAAAAQSLLGNAAARQRMTAAAAAITEGRGAALIADAMLGRRSNASRHVRIRDASEEDAHRAWLWRNDPDTRAASQTREPIAWKDHLDWWLRALASANRLLMVAEADGQPAAILRFDRTGEGREVSINLHPAARGSGLGRTILAAGVAELEAREGPQPFLAVIHASNPASRRVFEALGFRRIGPLGGGGFDRYVRPQAGVPQGSGAK